MTTEDSKLCPKTSIEASNVKENNIQRDFVSVNLEVKLSIRAKRKASEDKHAAGDILHVHLLSLGCCHMLISTEHRR